MSIILVLGLFAGLYFLWLIFLLATHAFPISLGLAVVLWLHHHGYGFPTSVLAGFSAAIAAIVTGQRLFEIAQSPALRLLIALLFVLPAGFASYQIVYGLAGLAIAKGITLTALSVAGGIIAARAAWDGVAKPPPDAGVPAASSSRRAKR